MFAPVFDIAAARTLDGFVSYAPSRSQGSVLESIQCPGCKKPIRVPDEVLGQTAKCPFCKCHFQAPVRSQDGKLTTPQLTRRNPFAGSRTFGPGVLLIFLGLLGLLSNARIIGRAYSDPEMFADQTRQQLESVKLDDYVDRTIKWMPTVRIGFLALNLLVIAGGISAIAQRWHGLAMIGSAAALFDAADCCCILGFPAGGWALFVLMNPGVRAQFTKPRPSEAA